MYQLVKVVSVIFVFSLLSACDGTTSVATQPQTASTNTTVDVEDCTNHDEANSSFSFNKIPVQGCPVN